MGLQFYKPTKAVKGSAVHFTFNSKGDKKGVFLEIIKQTGWDQSARGGQGNGTFKDGEKALIKFSLNEVGDLINSLERRVDAPQFYHKTDEGSSSISFKQYKGKVKDGDQWVDAKENTGWSLGVVKGADKKWAIAFTYGEAVLLREFLKNALIHCLDSLYSSDLKQAKEYADKKASNESNVEKPKLVKDFISQDKEKLDNSDIPF
jgi:hypothetical protein